MSAVSNYRFPYEELMKKLQDGSCTEFPVEEFLEHMLRKVHLAFAEYDNQYCTLERYIDCYVSRDSEDIIFETQRIKEISEPEEDLYEPLIL